jgi:hypothetical protein
MQMSLPDGVYVGLTAVLLLKSGLLYKESAEVSARIRQSLHIKSVSEWGPVCIGPYCQAVTVHQSLLHIAGMSILSAGPNKPVS